MVHVKTQIPNCEDRGKENGVEEGTEWDSQCKMYTGYCEILWVKN